MNQPKVSVVTVVFNDAKGLERTIKSVINQTYENVEFIIIDGGSTDWTIDVIKKYEDRIDYWVSEKDGGIYDAMYKGIEATPGTWVNIMNAGDVFFDDDVLRAVNFQEFEQSSLIYGNKLQNGKTIYPLKIEKLKIGEIMACHQSMFFNKKILNNDLFYDARLLIYADYELVNKIYLKYNSFIYLDQVISVFEGGGISSRVSMQKRKDKYFTLYKYYGLFGLMHAIAYRSLKRFRNA